MRSERSPDSVCQKQKGEMPPFTIDEIKPEQLEFGDAGTGANGQRMVGTSYRGERIVKVQLCRKEDPLRAPFGLSTPLGESNGRLTLDLEATDELAGWLARLDEAVVKAALSKCDEWFGHPMSEADVRSRHCPLLKAGKPGYPMTVRTKVKTTNAVTEVFLTSDDPDVFPRGGVDDLKRNARLVPVAQLSSVWFVGKMFGVSLAVERVIVVKEEAEDPDPASRFVGLSKRARLV